VTNTETAESRVSANAVATHKDRKFNVQLPVAMPEVIEIVSDSEEERM